MKYSKADIDRAWAVLDKYKGRAVKAIVSSVSRSGMSRRIEFYATGTEVDYNGKAREGKPSIDRITWAIAYVLGYPMNDQGLRVDGCGMDMCFATISNLNYMAAMRDLERRCPGMGLSIHSEDGKAILGLKADDRIYDTYFFNANRL